VILSGEDPVTRAVAVRHLASLAALDARLIQEYRVTSDRLADRKVREEAQQQELSGLHEDAKREQAEVHREVGKRRVILAKVRDERAYHERMVGGVDGASTASRRSSASSGQATEAGEDSLTEGWDRSPAVGFGALKGRLPADRRKIVTGYGAQVRAVRYPDIPEWSRYRGGGRPGSPGGTPAHVIYTGWFKGYGNLIIMDHGNEYYTLYAHIADIEAKEGEDVRQGQRIGTVGDTGSLAGPRLYFEVRYQGKPQDPEQWLRQGG
jgi:murein DD-endopeptidase MepM/ murein hydrolase activator NlpD